MLNTFENQPKGNSNPLSLERGDLFINWIKLIYNEIVILKSISSFFNISHFLFFLGNELFYNQFLPHLEGRYLDVETLRSHSLCLLNLK